jgi:hypothetical protein
MIGIIWLIGQWRVRTTRRIQILWDIHLSPNTRPIFAYQAHGWQYDHDNETDEGDDSFIWPRGVGRGCSVEHCVHIQFIHDYKVVNKLCLTTVQARLTWSDNIRTIRGHVRRYQRQRHRVDWKTGSWSDLHCAVRCRCQQASYRFDDPGPKETVQEITIVKMEGDARWGRCWVECEW